MCLLIAYFISNISAKNYQNRFMCVKVIARAHPSITLQDFGGKIDCSLSHIWSQISALPFQNDVTCLQNP